MFPNSHILGPLFWIVMGLLYAVLIYAFAGWTKDKNIKMTWWKWALSAGFYLIASLSLASSFTMLGEKEATTFRMMLLISGMVSVILGVLLYRFVLKPE